MFLVTLILAGCSVQQKDVPTLAQPQTDALKGTGVRLEEIMIDGKKIDANGNPVEESPIATMSGKN
jgi:hypothetical protein